MFKGERKRLSQRRSDPGPQGQKTMKKPTRLGLERKLRYQRLLLDMTFEEFGSVPVMDGAYRKTRRGKRGKKPEAIFELHETENLIKLGDWILSGSYTPAELDAFMIFEPKPREINAPSFRDKIVQRNLTDNIVYPALAPSIPFNAFAAQTGKGQHYGLDMLERQMRTYFLRKKAEDEKRRKEQGLPYRPMEEWDYSDGWVIKGDVRKCFPSTDHDKLKAAVYPRLSDERFRCLLGLYIDQVKGLALGHQTSHICAVYYLSKFLHYLNQDLGCSLSGMFMDDWYAIVDSKERAKEVLAKSIAKFAELGYELNEKTEIYPLRHGIDFCGFRVYLTRTGKVIRKLRTSSKKKMKRRIGKWEKDYAAGLITREEIEQSFQSACAHYKHGNTKELIRELRRRVDAIYEAHGDVPINNERRNASEQENQHTSGRKPGEAQRKRRCKKVHLPPA